MSEFAYTGIGANPHFGTPGNPADRKRVPGGSSSGAVVSAADGMCEIAIGSDTGGSCRIPAAICGIVGYKPSRQRIPTDGAFPLSYSIDSIGPIARTVEACARADAVMAAEDFVPLEPAQLAGLRIGIAQGAPVENLDEIVSKRFAGAVDQLRKAGARLSDEKLALLADMADVNSKGGVHPAEAFAVHRETMSRRADDIDPNVRVRLERARSISAADYVDMVRRRAQLVRLMDQRLAGLDILALPTTSIVAPTMQEVASADEFARRNLMLLRNTVFVNFFDLCAISVPIPREGGLPAGLMLVARNGQDNHLFRVAMAVERLFGG
jgi:aspartyl-tRNA(Asn)/glutamyl-tRNA(Gln) amidotransferase subunit A